MAGTDSHLVAFTREQLDTPIAELQAYGLTCRIINALEDELSAIWIRDLIGASEQLILETHDLGSASLNKLKRALARWYKATSTAHI